MCDMGENKFLTSKSIKREALIITRKVNHDDTEKLLQKLLFLSFKINQQEAE